MHHIQTSCHSAARDTRTATGVLLYPVLQRLRLDGVCYRLLQIFHKSYVDRLLVQSRMPNTSVLSRDYTQILRYVDLLACLDEKAATPHIKLLY